MIWIKSKERWVKSMVQNKSATPNKRQIGALWEQAALAYLVENGYEILETNYRCKIGEIDIIGKNDGYLTFIEVKYRKNSSMGSPFEAINPVKQNTIRKTASYYMLCHNLGTNTACRFDAVGILGTEITLIKDAF